MSSEAYRSTLTITLDDGTVLTDDAAREYVRRAAPVPSGETVRLELPASGVGTLDWAGAWDVAGAPVRALGAVDVPADLEVTLYVEATNLAFLADLPGGVLTGLHVGACDAGSFAAVRALAPGLRQLYLAGAELDDSVLAHVAALGGLTYLQTFGNRFSDDGVQVLGALTGLEDLYLEEADLTVAAFAFVERLPRLQRLGVQDVDLTEDELAGLRNRLPTVRVG